MSLACNRAALGETLRHDSIRFQSTTSFLAKGEARDGKSRPYLIKLQPGSVTRPTFAPLTARVLHESRVVSIEFCSAQTPSRR